MGKETIRRFTLGMLITLIAVVSAILIAGGWYVYLLQYHGIREERIDDLHTIGELKSLQIYEWRQEREDDARVIATGLVRKTFLEWRDTHDDDLLKVIEQRFQEYSANYDYYDIDLRTPDGTLILGTNQEFGDEQSEIKVLLAQSLAEKAVVFGDLMRCTISDRIHLDLAVPVLDNQDDPVAVIVIRTDPEIELYPLIESWPTSNETAETLLARRDGDNALLLNVLRHSAAPPLTTSIPLTKIDVPSVQAISGTVGIFDGLDYRNVPVMADIRPVPDSPWFMITKIDRDELLAEARFRGGLILILVALGIGLTSILAVYLRSRENERMKQAVIEAERGKRQVQEEARATLYSIGDGVIATDKQGIVTRMNPVAEQLTGWKESEARGKLLNEVFQIRHETTGAIVKSPVERVLKEGHIVGLANHTLLVAKDGKQIPIADSGAPIHDDNGAIAGVVLVFRDQTAERAAEAELQASREQFRRAVLNSPYPIMIHDEDGAIVQLSHSWCEISGYSEEELRTIGDWTERAFGERNQHDKEVIDQLYDADGSIYGGHYPIRTKSGELRIWEFSSSALGEMPDERRLVISMAKDVTERRKFEQENKILFEKMLDGFALHEIIRNESGAPIDYRFLRVNPAFESITGLNAEEIMGKTVLEVLPQTEKFWIEIYGQLVDDGEPIHFQHFSQTFDRYFEVTALRIGSNQFACFFTDVTERHRFEKEREVLQAQLLQAHKMESVGRLAGGVAHNFNNMLNVILGYTELSLEELDGSHPVKNNLEEIQNAAKRSAALTRQLLAFARKQTISPVVIDLNETIDGMLNMLERLIGENIELVWKPGEDLWQIEIDPSQIDQILANLAVNARDAIKETGNLTIETGNVTLDDDYCAENLGFIPGDFVTLSVSDTGCGIKKKNLEHIFEPFFTTKELGKGTGLGLATVYGIVKQNNGFVNIYSEEGEGTTVRIYLPRTKAELTTVQTSAQEEISFGNETILLVEDELGILGIASSILESHGYQVLTANTPMQALQLVENFDGKLDLLITDVVMPEMNGKQLKDQLIKTNPNMKVIYMSGYTANVIAHHGVLDAEIEFLQKPFSNKMLASKVREVLDRPEKGCSACSP